MNPLKVFVLLLARAAAAARASTDAVELNFGLLPGRDMTAVAVTESIMTLRVLEDRGIVARSNGRLSDRPTTLHVVNRQSVRYITAPAGPDGSFVVEMRYLDRSSALKALDGREQVMPDRTPLKGVTVKAIVERDGQLRTGSVTLTGVEAALQEPLRAMMASVLGQAAKVEPIRLTREDSVTRDIAMKLPVPGITSLDLTMRVVHRLTGVDNGIATVQLVYSMDFGSPGDRMKMTAQGSGGGTLLYEVASRTLLSNVSNSLMRLVLDTPEGVIEMDMNARQSHTLRPSADTSR